MKFILVFLYIKFCITSAFFICRMDSTFYVFLQTVVILRFSYDLMVSGCSIVYEILKGGDVNVNDTTWLFMKKMVVMMVHLGLTLGGMMVSRIVSEILTGPLDGWEIWLKMKYMFSWLYTIFSVLSGSVLVRSICMFLYSHYNQGGVEINRVSAVNLGEGSDQREMGRSMSMPIPTVVHSRRNSDTASIQSIKSSNSGQDMVLSDLSHIEEKRTTRVTEAGQGRSRLSVKWKGLRLRTCSSGPMSTCSPTRSPPNSKGSGVSSLILGGFEAEQ